MSKDTPQEPFDEVLGPAADDRNAPGADAAASPTEGPEDAAPQAAREGAERGVGAPRGTEPGGVQGSPPDMKDAGEAGGDPGDVAARIAQEREAYRDQLLRARADFDNFRKRMERERLQMATRATEDAVRDFLPIVDDLERALAADPGDAAGTFHQGVQMIYLQMLEMLRRRGVEPIDSIGEDFDPNIHEAVAYEPAKGRREGEIIGELRRGYRIGERLVRPAMVRVAQELH